MQVNNGVVSMDWDSNLFFSKDKGRSFVVAVQPYEVDGKEIGIIFRDQRMFVSSPAVDGNRFPLEKLHNAKQAFALVKALGKSDELGYIDEFDEEIVEIGGLSGLDAKGSALGLDVHAEDILARNTDLSSYFALLTIGGTEVED